MSRALLFLDTQRTRDLAKEWIDNAPPMTRVEFKGPRRTLEQNSKMWACLTDIAVQLQWGGVYLSPTDWKQIFIDAFRKGEIRMAPNLDGDGWVNLTHSSADLSKEEMSELIELMMMFCAKHNVRLSEGIRR